MTFSSPFIIFIANMILIALQDEAIEELFVFKGYWQHSGKEEKKKNVRC